MIHLTISAESATVSRDPRGVRVHLNLAMQDIVRAVTEGLEDVPEVGKPVPVSALRRQIAKPLLLSLEPVDAVRLVDALMDSEVDAAALTAVSRIVAKVCTLARHNPGDADLLAVVAHMRQESGAALCHVAPYLSGGAG